MIWLASRRIGRRLRKNVFPIALLLLFCFWGSPPPLLADWTPLIERLVADGFNEKATRDLFARPEVRFDPVPMASKITVLINRREKRKDISPRQLRAMYLAFLQPHAIAGARAYALENSATLERIHQLYCVPEEVIVAILLVETRLGQNVGNRPALITLSSMALCQKLETIQPHLPTNLITSRNAAFARQRCLEKANWAYEELKALIRYAALSGEDPLRINGSLYGAIGLCQFMPSNVFLYGVDVQQKGRVDLFTKEDALYSIANYLRRNGWQCTMSRKSRYKVIFAYNHSHTYASTILAVTEKLKTKKPLRPA